MMRPTSILTSSIILTLLLNIFSGCANTEVCEDEVHNVLDSAESGNFAYVKNYLEDGGDPDICCYAMPSGSGRGIPFPDSKCLYKQLMYGDMTVEFAKYYLTYVILDEHLNDMLDSYIVVGDSVYPERASSDSIADLLIEKGAHYDPMYSSYDSEYDFQAYRFLAERDYDFNWQDPEYGYTLLMHVADCRCDTSDVDAEQTINRIIEITTFLTDHGARTDIKDNKGLTVLQHATNQKIKDHIKSLEK